MANDKEVTLIKDIQKTLAKAVGYDPRGQGGYDRVNGREIPDTSTYIKSEFRDQFQALAKRVARAFDEQGAEHLDPRLLAVVNNLRRLSDMEYNHASSLGFAFKNAMEAFDGPAGKPQNPFRNKPPGLS